MVHSACLRSSIVLVAGLLAGCGSPGDTCSLATAGCPCTSAGACDPGLSCQAGTCTGGSAAGGGGGPGGGGGGGSPTSPASAGSSAGHQWCMGVAKGRRVAAPRIETMWAASANDAWFVTNRAMAIDGVPPPYSPPGTPPPVLGVGHHPSLIHWDGETFCQTKDNFLLLDLDQAALYAIWGSSATDIYVVGHLNSALHWDGRSWRPTTISSDSSDELVAITGRGPNDIYVVADGGSGLFRSIRGGDLLHWDGRAWNPILRDGHGFNFEGGSKIWLANDGRIWLTSIDDIRDGADGCQLGVLEGGSFSCRIVPGFGTGSQYVRDLGGDGRQPWVMVKNIADQSYTVWTPNGTDFTYHDLHEPMYAVQGFSDSQLWVSADSGIWRWNGSGWVEPDPSSKPIGGFWGSRSNDVWGWNQSQVFRFEGQVWKQIAP